MSAYYDDGQVALLLGDALTVLRTLPDGAAQMCVTSPPYWGLRDYGVAGQLGLEPTPEEYVANMVAVFREVRRVLRADGTVWLNLGDSYAASRGGTLMPAETLAGGVGGFGDDAAHRGRPQVPDSKNPNAPIKTYQPHRNAEAIGLKHKDLVGIPWRVAFALQADGWYLRSDIIWSKPNPMPESVTDRPTKSHEYLFLLSKAARYYYDADAIREPAAPSSAARLSQVNLANQPGGAKSDGYADQFPGKRGRDRKPTEILQDMAAKRSKKISEDIAYEDTRNRRSVWHIPTQAFPEAHFATFPEDLVEPCILAGCPEGGVVLDPFIGSGTTAMVARQLGRRAVGIDLNEEYLEMAVRRIGTQMALIGGEA